MCRDSLITDNVLRYRIITDGHIRCVLQLICAIIESTSKLYSSVLLKPYWESAIQRDIYVFKYIQFGVQNFESSLEPVYYVSMALSFFSLSTGNKKALTNKSTVRN